MMSDNIQLVEEYVYKNYKAYKGKTLIIAEHRNHFSVRRHKDEAPLVLGKTILNLI